MEPFRYNFATFLSNSRFTKLNSNDWGGGPVLTRGIYKELSSFSGSLSGFTPKPSPPKQFTIIKAKTRTILADWIFSIAKQKLNKIKYTIFGARYQTSRRSRSTYFKPDSSSHFNKIRSTPNAKKACEDTHFSPLPFEVKTLLPLQMQCLYLHQ